MSIFDTGAELSDSQVTLILDDASILDHSGVLDDPLWFDVTFESRFAIRCIWSSSEKPSTLVHQVRAAPELCQEVECLYNRHESAARYCAL